MDAPVWLAIVGCGRLLQPPRALSVRVPHGRRPGARFVPCSFLDVSRAQVMPYLVSRRRRAGLKDARIAVSGEFRRGLALLPAFDWLNQQAAAAFERIPEDRRQALRERVRWPVRVEKWPPSPWLNDRYVKVQVRRYFHSPAKLAHRLGWQPPLDYERGLEISASWLRSAGL